MTPSSLKEEVDVIKKSGDRDLLISFLINLIYEFAPSWVKKELDRLWN